MLNAGKYKAAPTSWMMTATKDGSPQVAVEFEIVEGENSGETIVWSGGFSTDGAQEYTVKALLVMGWNSRFKDMLLEHQPVQIVVENDTYEGKKRARVKYVNASGGLAGWREFDASRLASFEDQMRSKVAAIKAKDSSLAPATTTRPVGNVASPPSAGAAKQPPARHNDAPPEDEAVASPPAFDDDIPF